MRHNWSREETIIAFNLYCKIPFSVCNSHHPEIIKYAQILNRTPSALGMKIGNLARFDSELKQRGVSGLTHGAKMEEIIWNEFKANPDQMAYESELLVAEYSKRNLMEVVNLRDEILPSGEEREVLVKQRVNQHFFRSVVLSSYNNTCAVSGVEGSNLLEACHIVSWSDDKANRTNPQNGICLNVFFHKAYDMNLMAITPDFKIIISDEMLEQNSKEDFRLYLRSLNGSKIALPDKFKPSRDLLQMHYEQYKIRYK